MKTPTLDDANRGEITALTRLTQRHPVASAFFAWLLITATLLSAAWILIS